MTLFDGLPDIFTGCFGEAVVYTPAGGGPVAIDAIVIERPASDDFAGADSDARSMMLHVRAADIADPREGDTVLRSGTSETFRIVPPIRPDGQGMIVCALAATE